MDKKLIFAVAGSGKTTHIVESLSCDRRALIVTYTNGNYDNLRQKITKKFNNQWPENITLMTYFSFLYNFCYKPLLSDRIRACGILLDTEMMHKQQAERRAHGVSHGRKIFYMTTGNYFYTNRLAYFIERYIMDDVKERIEMFFDTFVIDEVQDIAGRDFNFLEQLMATNVNMLFVGDFYQHTFDTSRDGNTNKSLFNSKTAYQKRFTDKGLKLDSTTLIKSWRCSQSISNYIQDNLGISMSSHRPATDNTSIEHITEARQITSILNEECIIKLHYQNGAKFGIGHKNWGESKGEDHYHDVCVLLNPTTLKRFKAGKLTELPLSTKNKLYVAITRARGNVYFIDEPKINKREI